MTFYATNWKELPLRGGGVMGVAEVVCTTNSVIEMRLTEQIKRAKRWNDEKTNRLIEPFTWALSKCVPYLLTSAEGAINMSEKEYKRSANNILKYVYSMPNQHRCCPWILDTTGHRHRIWHPTSIATLIMWDVCPKDSQEDNYTCSLCPLGAAAAAAAYHSVKKFAESSAWKALFLLGRGLISKALPTAADLPQQTAN